MRRTKEQARITRHRILDKALSLFVQKGYYNTSQEEIVNALDLSRGAFYGHFKSKEDLLYQLLEREFQFISSLVTNCFVSDADEKYVFSNLLQQVLNNFYDNKRFRNIIELTWFKMEIDVSSKIMQDKTSFNEFFIEEIQTILLKAKKNNKLKPNINPNSAALQTTSMISGIYRLYFVTPAKFRNKSISLKMMLDFTNQLFL